VPEERATGYEEWRAKGYEDPTTPPVSNFCSGFRVQGSGFRVQEAGFRVQGSGFRVQGSGFSPAVSNFCFGGWG